MMRIHEDANGVRVNALSMLSSGEDVTGHVYQVIAGAKSELIEFQRGPVKERGVNGLTNEALLAILIHRTKHLQTLFPCRENAIAITNMEQALMWLEERTRSRVARGVEGTNVT